MQVSIVFAAATRLWRQTLDVPAGSTAAQAVADSDFALEFPEYTDQPLTMAIYGERCDPQRVLHEHDRVELCRPLVFDPLESRRRRVAHRAGKHKSGAG
ncbi:RnfH family protein [Castellaniella sp.]|uniref:RnfH family protein n=1 Tax=Castellaniella sp. TaxID=1955812 RepID=UPI002AFE677B|nr:RnfH family protein [Castellaniella sp.]